MKGIKIIATGKYLPKKIATNEDFAKLVETSDEWIVKRTGMRERHISSGEPTWLMGVLAAKAALAKSGVDPLSIDLLVFTTVTPDFCTPSMACLAQAQLGAANAMCFDLNAACSGFVYALDLARRYLNFEDINRVLIISSETLSKITDYTDRATCVLFGDGAGAVVLEKSDAMFASQLGADGTKAGLLYCQTHYQSCSPFVEPALVPAYEAPFVPNTPYMHMDGQEVYKFAVRAFPEAVRAACDKAGIAVEDLDLIVPHQANIRIVETAAKVLKVPMEKMYVNLERYGNSSSACGPICLDELMECGRLAHGQKVAIAGFGGGVTYAAVVMEM